MGPNRPFRLKLVLPITLLCLSHPVALGREASSIGGFSLKMSSDEIASIARTRLGLKIVHSDDSLDLYDQGDDPDRTVRSPIFHMESMGTSSACISKSGSSKSKASSREIFFVFCNRYTEWSGFDSENCSAIQYSFMVTQNSENMFRSRAPARQNRLGLFYVRPINEETDG